MALDLWVEKYRPSTVDTYVFQSEQQEKQVRQWITDKSISHLIFSGPAGTGKTSLAKVLINELGVNAMDTLYINASRENSVENVRRRITQFSETMPFGDFKIILLDEADHLSTEAQAALRGVMEMYHASVRFILTCNYPQMIIPAIHSRCQSFHMDSLNKTEFTARVATILIDNEVEFTLDVLDSYVKATYPDLRKTINTVQEHVINNTLEVPHVNSNTTDWKLKMVELFKAGKMRDARTVICKNARLDEYNEIYTFLYQNLDFFGKTEDAQDEAIIIIAKGMVDHTRAADPEINLSATMAKLQKIQ